MRRNFKIIKICSTNTQNYDTSINFDKTKSMIFGTRQDQRSDLNLGGHKLDIYTDFKYLGVIL